jgi:hypothetical protein
MRFKSSDALHNLLASYQSSNSPSRNVISLGERIHLNAEHPTLTHPESAHRGLPRKTHLAIDEVIDDGSVEALTHLSDCLPPLQRYYDSSRIRGEVEKNDLRSTCF